MHQFVGFDQRSQLFGQMLAMGKRLAFEHYDELLSTDPIKTVRYADTQLYDLGDVLEDPIARGMAMNVVNALKVIEVDQ